MKNILRIVLWMTVFSVFVIWAGCAEDEAKPENFKTLGDAETALFETEDDIFAMLEQLGSATEVAMTFDGSYPANFSFKTRKTYGARKQLSPRSFGYNAQTGYWTFDTTATATGLTLSANGKIKFTPHDAVTGLPNDLTNMMEYSVAAVMQEYEGESYVKLEYDTDLLVAGIAAYRDTAGNATINGSESLDFSLDIMFETEHLVGEYAHAYTISDVIVSPTLPYPQSGRIDFTIKRKLNAQGYGSDFYIKGSIVFDGTNIAVLEFGGFTFDIDLDGPTIVGN